MIVELLAVVSRAPAAPDDLPPPPPPPRDPCDPEPGAPAAPAQVSVFPRSSGVPLCV